MRHLFSALYFALGVKRDLERDKSGKILRMICAACYFPIAPLQALGLLFFNLLLFHKPYITRHALYAIVSGVLFFLLPFFEGMAIIAWLAAGGENVAEGLPLWSAVPLTISILIYVSFFGYTAYKVYGNLDYKPGIGKFRFP